MNDNGQPEYRDKGGRILKGGKWFVYNYLVEVAVEYPSKEMTMEKAIDISDDVMKALARVERRAGECFVSITQVDAYGFKRPDMMERVLLVRDDPQGEPVKPKAVKVVKATKKVNVKNGSKSKIKSKGSQRI